MSLSPLRPQCHCKWAPGKGVIQHSQGRPPDHYPECSVLNIGFSFDVGRSMFDVRRSSFKLKETSHVPERLPRDQKPEDTDADLTQ